MPILTIPNIKKVNHMNYQVTLEEGIIKCKRNLSDQSIVILKLSTFAASIFHLSCCNFLNQIKFETNKMNQKIFFLSLISIILLGLGSCQKQEETPLPILGIPKISDDGDTIHHTIPEFNFIDQDSNLVTKESFNNKIYVADFFFTSCPSICPTMTRQMKRIYENFENEDRLMFISHSIDTRYDTVPVLKAYADKLNIDDRKWRFVTGEKSEIMGIANDYFNVAYEDPDAPGGYDHSGKFILVDTEGHIRSFCQGTDPEEVTEFIKDIQKLLKETGEKGIS